MKRKVFVITLVMLSIILGNTTVSAAPASGSGFDEFGYNPQAHVWVGIADGIDGNLDGTIDGDPTYAKDYVVTKWNAEWDRGTAEYWANPPYDAWKISTWNGAVAGGSGEVDHSKFVWVGDCDADPSLVPEGGDCIWHQFAMIMVQGKDSTGHFWFLHANPTGFGSYP